MDRAQRTWCKRQAARLMAMGVGGALAEWMVTGAVYTGGNATIVVDCAVDGEWADARAIALGMGEAGAELAQMVEGARRAALQGA